MSAMAKLPMIDVAKVAHEVERTYRSSTHDGTPAPAWDELDEQGRDNAVRKVRAFMSDPSIAIRNPAEALWETVVRSLVADSL